LPSLKPAVDNKADQRNAHIGVLLTNLFFAANYSLAKTISPSKIGPFGLNLLRVGICVILFWSLWLFSRNSARIRKEHWLRFILCGLSGVAVNQMLFMKGLTMTSTIHASLLMLCTPLLITLLAFWVLKEKVTIIKITGLLLGIAGAVFLVSSKDVSGTASLRGDLFIILNAIAYTIYFILVKPLMNYYHPLHVVRWVFSFGLIFMLPFCWAEFISVNWTAFAINNYLALAFIVFAGTFLAYLFNAHGLKALGAGITGAYIYTQPVFASIIAMVVLGERFTMQKIVAGVLIFTGVFLVSKKAPPVIEE
jgi:drug/metabolite transporter (DMT)-like permease